MRVTLTVDGPYKNEMEEFYDVYPELEGFFTAEGEERFYYAMNEVELDVDFSPDGTFVLLAARVDGQEVEARATEGDG